MHSKRGLIPSAVSGGLNCMSTRTSPGEAGRDGGRYWGESQAVNLTCTCCATATHPPRRHCPRLNAHRIIPSRGQSTYRCPLTLLTVYPRTRPLTHRREAIRFRRMTTCGRSWWPPIDHSHEPRADDNHSTAHHPSLLMLLCCPSCVQGVPRVEPAPPGSGDSFLNTSLEPPTLSAAYSFCQSALTQMCSAPSSFPAPTTYPSSSVKVDSGVTRTRVEPHFHRQHERSRSWTTECDYSSSKNRRSANMPLPGRRECSESDEEAWAVHAPSSCAAVRCWLPARHGTRLSHEAGSESLSAQFQC